jgi:predicted HD phosphohydrolase|tara:strand:+ start:301 stop:873 length:573 start_codon:yes stop_codon:yes gene_type:complete
MTESRAKFTQMKDGDAEDYSIIAASNAKDYDHLADKVLTHLQMLKDDYGGFQVDRLTHSLQTATRAYRDGRDEEYVVCALIHDIGDNLAPANHAEFAATILQPFVSEENYWIVKHHGIFQGYYFFEFLGLDKNMREQFIDNPYYESCKEFCEKYDQNSFDPDYETLELEFFIPMVKKLFKKPKRSIYLQS